MPTVHPHSHYTDFNLPQTPAAVQLNLTAEPLSDVPGLFRRLSEQGELLAARDSGIFVAGREYRYTGENVQDIDAAINHFQGMVRLGRGRDAFLMLSAGDSTELVAHLFVLAMGSRKVHGPWGSNLRTRGTPPESDGIVRVIALERARWHPGGLAVLGDVLVVPVEGNGVSAVHFLHVADPQNPTHIPITIDRPEFPNAGAAALGRLPNGRVLCLVWREMGSEAPVGRIDCYVSRSENLFEGFGPPTTVRFPKLPGNQSRDPKYQSVMLLHPEPSHSPPDTLFYLLATENGAPDAPFGNGANLVDLFRIRAPQAQGAANAAGPLGEIEYVDTVTCRAPRTFCNFDAAAGGYVDVSPGGPCLHLYSAWHWRNNRTVQFSEFAGRPEPSLELTDIGDAWIDLHEHQNFQGRRLAIHGQDDATIPEYARIYVQDGDFDQRVSSVRWQVPVGWTYRLFRDPGFSGAALNLAGTGKLETIADLSKRKFGDVVSSSRYASRP